MRPIHLFLAFPLMGCALSQPERTSGMTTLQTSDSRALSTRRQVKIELLALDLATCGRCTRTDRNLDDALAKAASVLREKMIDVEVVKHVVASSKDAERLRFLSSPTIRIDGEDIALDLRESPCDDCGELCGCEGRVSCRVWVWNGKEYLEAPTEMIVASVLKAADTRATPKGKPGTPYVMPENLRTFFASLAKTDAAKRTARSRVACCSHEAQSECCGASE